MKLSYKRLFWPVATTQIYFANIAILLCCLTICTGVVDQLEECKKTDDSHVTRGNFTCCSNSPRSVPLQSSLDFQNGWKKCAVEPKNTKEDPVISAWRVYRCIIFQGLRRKPLLPTTFADLMTAKYPALIKSQIHDQMSKLEHANMKFDVDVECLKRTPYPKVHLLRNIFYDIEQEICEAGHHLHDHSSGEFFDSSSKTKGSSTKKSSSLTPSDFFEDVLCETCDRRLEMYHRNGDCCSHIPIPFPFIHLPYRYGNDDRVNQCAEDLVHDVGLPVDTEFSTHLQYLCYASCEHYLGGTLQESDLWAGMQVLQTQTNLRSLVIKMTPKYFSPKYKQYILRYVTSNFQTAWKKTKTFESKIQLSQRDTRNCDKDKLQNLLASCKTHKLIETITNLYLNNLCLEEYTLQKPNSGTTPNNLNNLWFGFNNNVANTTVTAINVDEVTLNFEWGRPNRNHNRGDYYRQQDEVAQVNAEESNSKIGNITIFFPEDY